MVEYLDFIELIQDFADRKTVYKVKIPKIVID